MNEDTLYEEKRLDELDRTQAFFLWYYSIPKGFREWTNYKQGDKYVIELSTNDKKCAMKLEIDRKMYDMVNDYVTTRDKKPDDMWNIMHYLMQKLEEKEDK